MPKLKKTLGLKNNLAVPTIKYIKINVGLGEALTNSKALESMSEALTKIAVRNLLLQEQRKQYLILKSEKMMKLVLLLH